MPLIHSGDGGHSGVTDAENLVSLPRTDHRAWVTSMEWKWSAPGRERGKAYEAVKDSYDRVVCSPLWARL
jgi:hypothetical protein